MNEPIGNILIPEVIPELPSRPPGRPRGSNYEKNQKWRRPKGKEARTDFPKLADGRKWGQNICVGDRNVEHPIQVDAYELYKSMEHPQMTVVADRIGVSVPTIRKWAAKWDWKGRVARLASIDADQRGLEPLSVTTQTKKDFLAVLRHTLERYIIRDKKTGEIKGVRDIPIKSVSDIKVLIQAFKEVFNDESFKAAAPGFNLNSQNTAISFVIKK